MSSWEEQLGDVLDLLVVRAKHAKEILGDRRRASLIAGVIKNLASSVRTSREAEIAVRAAHAALIAFEQEATEGESMVTGRAMRRNRARIDAEIDLARFELERRSSPGLSEREIYRRVAKRKMPDGTVADLTKEIDRLRKAIPKAQKRGPDSPILRALLEGRI